MSPLLETTGSKEDGMLTVFSFFTVVFLFALAVLVGNVMMVVNRKIEVQNAGDAVAVSAGTQMARGLNQITAINHLKGELLAIVVLHNAMGGDQLRDTRDRNLPEDDALDAAAGVARGLGASTFAHRIVGQKMKADATLLDSWRDLKRALTALYAAQAAAKALEKVPFVGEAGTALYAASLPLEAFMAAEGAALQALYAAVKATDPIARVLFRQGLDGLGTMAEAVRTRMPGLIRRTAREIGTRNNARGTVSPGGQGVRMPVIADPTPDGASDEDMARSQGVRASWPWVAFHRRRVLQLTSWMVFSRTSAHYLDYTQRFTLSKTRELYQRGTGRFLMLADSQPNSKGEEAWTNNSAQLEGHFALLGIAHRDAPRPWGVRLYAQHNPDGLVGFAQTLVYNANLREAQRRQGVQPSPGWDTLNWAPLGAGNTFVPPEFPADPAGDGSPMIKLSWQVKLVPVSGGMLRRAREAAGPAARALQRVEPDSRLAHTH